MRGIISCLPNGAAMWGFRGDGRDRLIWGSARSPFGPHYFTSSSASRYGFWLVDLIYCVRTASSFLVCDRLIVSACILLISKSLNRHRLFHCS